MILLKNCSFGINQHSFTKSCKMLKFLSEKCSFGINQHSFTKSCKMLKFLSEKLEIILRINKRLITGRTVSLYSQPFCTSWCGYKMCDRLYLNDDVMGKGTRLSLFFFVMRSENDALLPWPFHQRSLCYSWIKIKEPDIFQIHSIQNGQCWINNVVVLGGFFFI